MNRNMNRKIKDRRENFCPACLAVPLAFAGAGASSAGAKNSDSSNSSNNKILFWGGIGVLVLSLMVAVYYKYYKDCEACN